MIKNAKTFPRHRISIGLFLKNGREKRRRHFPNHAPKKAVKPVKVVSGRKNLAAIHTGFATFTAFAPVALLKCQFLASHISVDGPTKRRHIDRTVSRDPQHRTP